MVKNFEETKGALSLRLVAALEGGQAGGGDTRGQESAALLVVKKGCGVWLHNDTVLRLQVGRQSRADQGAAPAGREIDPAARLTDSRLRGG